MSVILKSSAGQARTSRRAGAIVLQPWVTAFCGLLLAAEVSRAETHWNLQAVDASGVSSWSGAFPISVTGVLLTDPDEMLDSTPNFVLYTGSADLFRMGGQWQMVVQAALPGDRLGTFLWMGQNYGNHPARRGTEFSYSNEAWAAEVARLNHDPATGRAFRKGDLVMVTANRSLFRGGKRNLNEAHDIDPAADFSMTLVVANYGLPAPEVLSPASVLRPCDGDPATREDIFDATRATGGEHWQGMRVRVTGLTLVTTNGWNATNVWSDRRCVATDGEGRFFTLRHPRHSLGPPPAHRFDAIGVFNQESESATDGTFGYELFVQEIAPSDDAVLSIALGVSGQAVISWPGSLAHYRLESAGSPDAAHWAPVTNPPALVNGRNTVVLEPDAAAGFFRLKRVR